ncbi:hypothetical protein BJF85_24270 [Saccharomonospora sp. CUA-673]|uniref:serine/threonine-protein kinase n=1 Tax=Saccharomonospora sp. CUA-673 TaxID=1904969 RepID=UPI000965E418|nr:serine/threonine-protein kinase [Saccharomonospora sp. CUA-673]OLT41243.1 hypothetical protein BJF85_24270 [Saccharomonospora sp. CUA-673]
MKPLKPEQAHPIGHYRPLALLGEGAMGQVFLCLGQDGRVAAVKQIHPSFSRDEGFRTRFTHEVQASRRVSGAYTAAVMDADPEAEAPWLASVYVAGPSLRDAIDAAGPLPVSSMRRLIAGLAVALSDVHRAGLIHRDLKPGNVLLTSDGPRVIDFGIARAAEGAEFTSTGTVVGSPAYMSPEQAEGHDLTAASDMFSLGALLVMAATGQGPFTGTTAAQTLYNVVHEPPTVDGVPAEIRPMIEACLARDPAARPTPQQLLDMVGPLDREGPMWPQAVQQLIQAQEAEVRTVLALPPPEPPAPPAKRRWPAVTGILAALAGVITLSLVQGLAPTEGIAIEPETRESPSEALTVDRLRTIDACQLLDGVELGDLTLEASPYSLSAHQCRFGESGSYGSAVTLALGATVDPSRMVSTGEQVAGLDVLTSQHDIGGCTNAVALPSDQQYGIELSVMSDDEHGLCEHLNRAMDIVIDELRVDPPVRDVPENSATRTDVCSLVDREAIAEIAGVVQTVSPDGLDQCSWRSVRGHGLAQVTLAPENTHGEDRDTEQIRLGDVPAQQRGMAGTCTVEWQHRTFEEQADDSLGPLVEIVRVTYSPNGDGNACRPARAVAEATLAEFPPAER